MNWNYMLSCVYLLFSFYLQRLRSSSCLLPPDLCGQYLWKSPTATPWTLLPRLSASREADLVSTMWPLTTMLRTRRCSSLTCETEWSTPARLESRVSAGVTCHWMLSLSLSCWCNHYPNIVKQTCPHPWLGVCHFGLWPWAWQSDVLYQY